MSCSERRTYNIDFIYFMRRTAYHVVFNYSNVCSTSIKRFNQIEQRGTNCGQDQTTFKQTY